MPPEDLTNFDVSQLDALAKLEADHRTIRALAEKAAWRRDKEVEIYSRVLSDYESRMATIVEQADPVRQRVRDDLQKLDVLYQRYGKALDQAKTQLQECEFRREIGEFNAEEFQRCQQAAERTIGEREGEFEGVRKLRLRYLELLPGEPVPLMTPGRVAPAPAREVAPPAPPVNPIATTPPVPPAPASPAPPPPAASVEATSPPIEESSPPTIGATMFVRPPSPTDFKVPSRGKASGDTEVFGTIAISAAMLIEDRGGLPGTHHRLGVLTLIGRTAENQIVIPIKEVSRRHAQIIMSEDGYLLKDLGSPNGTFVNGERVKEHRLQEGDKVTLGGKIFVFKAP
jgi:hypothetical protein